METKDYEMLLWCLEAYYKNQLYSSQNIFWCHYQVWTLEMDCHWAALEWHF